MELIEIASRAAGNPSATPNYITATGLAKLRADAAAVWARRTAMTEVLTRSAEGDKSENSDFLEARRSVESLDREHALIKERIVNAVVLDPSSPTQTDRVFFGCTVTYARVSDDQEFTVTILGSDETDGRRVISFSSPIARGLLGHSAGDVVRVETPRGSEEMEIISLSYPTSAQGLAQAA